MKTRIMLMTTLGLCAGLCASCRTPTSGISVESYPHNIVTVNSKIVGGCLTVTEVNAAMRNGLLQAQVRGQNTSQRDLQMEYRFRWVDDKGMEVDTRTAAWTQIGISAMEAVLMQGIAPAREVKDFILDVRFRRHGLRWE